VLGGRGRACGLWRVPFEVEGEAVATVIIARSAAVVIVRSAAVFLLFIQLFLELLLRLEGGTAVQQLDGVQGACVHTGSGSSRHARERLALICFD
jgi:hypothetical protein